MDRNNLFIILAVSALLLATSICCTSYGRKDAEQSKEYVVDFYDKLLGKQDFDTLDIWDSKKQVIVNQKDVLTQGYSFEELREMVEKSETYTDGEWMDTIVHISFPNGNDLYFQLTEGWSLNEIWLPDGSNLWSPSFSYKRPAIIRSDLLELGENPRKAWKRFAGDGVLEQRRAVFLYPCVRTGMGHGLP